MKPRRRTQAGQTVVEYVLLLVLVIGFVGIVYRFLPPLLISYEQLMERKFVAAYRYGNKDAKGYEEGAPERHPRAEVNGSFMMFRRTR